MESTRFVALGALVVFVLGSGCSVTVGSGGYGGEGGAEDGGGGGGGEEACCATPVAVLSEADACEALLDAYSGHGLEIGCPTTTRLCPDHLRVEYGTPCMEYTAASVELCVALYRSAATCDDLYASFDCRVDPVRDSAPNGCESP